MAQPPIPPKIRLLIVDDSIYMQMAIQAIIGLYPEIEVVGEAGDGDQAVEMAERLRPDIITMDVNMPGTNGLEATRRIMSSMPTPIIMLSSLTEKGVDTTFQALEYGAVDYVSKTSSALDIDLATIAEAVAAKIRFWGHRALAAKASPTTHPLPLPDQIDLAVITAGTGGPSLVAEGLRALDALPFPLLVMQEMPAGFTATFIDFLARTTGLPVREGFHHAPLAPDAVTILPGGRGGTVRRDEDGKFLLDLGRPTLFRDAAEELAISAVTAAGTPFIVSLLPHAPASARLAEAWRGKAGAFWIDSSDGREVANFTQHAATGLSTATLGPGDLAAAFRNGLTRRAA